MQTTPCQPCCTTVPPVQVPGPDGIAGSDGVDGKSAFTTTTSDFTIPAVGATVNVNVLDSSWMVYGQNVAIGDAATTKVANFTVTAIVSANVVTLTFLGYPGDQVAGAVLPSGSRVGTVGLWGLPTPLSSYTSPAYAVTGSQAEVTNGPSITFTVPGTYLLFAAAEVDDVAATAAGDTVTLNLYKTGVGAITNAQSVGKAPAYATAVNTIAMSGFPVVVYTAAAADNIVMWAGVTTNAHATVVKASIVAVRIA